MEAELIALLASVAGGRTYWGRKPQGETTRPYVVMQRISGTPNYTYSGASGYVPKRVQIDVYADTWTAARATANAIKAILSGYRGGTIQGAFIESEQDLPAAAPGETSTLFRTSLDIMIHHQET